MDATGDNIFRLSADTSGLDWIMLRAVYEHANRTGSGFDEQVLDDIGEQDSLRQFDISDRTSNRVSLLVQVTPVSPLSLHGTISAGNEDRPDTVNTGTGGKPEPVFGLLSNDNHSYSIGADYVPRQDVSFGAEYVWERYSTLQKSRQANPGVQFDDPTRDWTTDGSDKANTFTVSMDLLKLLQKKTDFRATYDYSHAETQYIYGLAPNTTLPARQPAPAGGQHAAAGDRRPSLSLHVALRRRLRLLVRQVRRQRFRVGRRDADQHRAADGAGADAGAQFPDDWVPDPAVHRPHLLGAVHVLLVGVRG